MTPADAKKAAAGGAAAVIRIYLLTQLPEVFELMKIGGGPGGEPFTDDDASLQHVAWVDLVKELCQRADVRCCRVCGCTDAIACEPDGCRWVGEEDLCSSCADQPSTILVVSR